jgi:hypothetical protein
MTFHVLDSVVFISASEILAEFLEILENWRS